MTTDRDELGAAHRLLKEQVDRYGVATIHALYFTSSGDGEEDVLSINTLKKVYKENLHGKTSKVQDAIIGFYRTVQAETDKEGEKRLYHILKSVLKLDDQSSAQNYVGGYACYRIQTGTAPPNLLTGRIEIEHIAADNSYRFTHTSDDSGLETDNPQLIHTGPFFVLVNRVYLLGLSGDIYGPYVRPIILQAHANPKRVPMRGVVLTESAVGNVPVAARTVLYHDDLHGATKAEHPGDAMNKVVLAELRVDAWNPTLPDGEPINATNLLGW